MSDGSKVSAPSPSKCSSTVASAATTWRSSASSGSQQRQGPATVKCYKRGASGTLVQATRKARSCSPKKEPAVPRIDINHIVKMREMFQDLDLKYDYKVDSPCSSGGSDVPSHDGAATRVPTMRGPANEHISELLLDKALDKMMEQRKKAQDTKSSSSSFFGFRLLSAFSCNGCSRTGTAIPSVSLEDEPGRVSSV